MPDEISHDIKVPNIEMKVVDIIIKDKDGNIIKEDDANG